MADLSHFWGQDLSVGPTGDIALVQPLNTQDSSTLDGNDEGTQRIYRRLMTNDANGGRKSGENIFAPKYGAGIPRRIGSTMDQPGMTALIRRQMFLEAAVAKAPAPQITVTESLPSTTFVEIQYVNAQTGTPLSLAFDPTQSRNT